MPRPGLLRLATGLTAETVYRIGRGAFNHCKGTAERGFLKVQRRFIMTTRFRSFAAAIGVLAVAAAGLTVSGAAQARSDVGWSIGLSAPGVGVAVGNAPHYYAPQPVYVQPAPIYSQPAPIYYAPQPVYVQPRPVYIQAPPVYVAPRPIYVQPGYGWRHGGPNWRDGRRDGHRGDWRR
jgi:hypothetical protein